MAEEQIVSESSAPAESAVETVETPVEAAPEAPSTPDDVWAKPFEFTAETEESTDTEEPETEVSPETPEVVAESEEQDEEEPEPIQLEADTNKPAPLTRRKLREVEEKLITPLRDPDAKIEDVWNGLYELNPQRAEELATTIAKASAEQFPDAWLETITGIEGITLESLKQKYSSVEPTQVNEGSDAEKVLTELYGDSWKDPSRDDELLDDHLPFAKMLRERTDSPVLSAKDEEIAKLREELNQLKPEVEGIKSERQKALELEVDKAKDAAVVEYREKIEKRSLPQLFEQAGLKVAENDTDSVKSVKEYIQSRFRNDNGFMSDFEVFTVSQFSDKENLAKVINRVDKYLSEATQAEVRAKYAKDPAEVRRLEQIAAARRGDAKAESDRLTVLHKKASQEFVKTIPLMSILQENADLHRRLALRGEIVNPSAPAVNSSWRDAIDPNDPWAGPTINERAAHLSRG